MPRWSYAVVLGAWAVSRLGYWAAGLRFDVGFTGSAMQVADLDLLDGRLLETTWYLHVQPPLFNAFVGVGANLFGSWGGLGFQLVYLGVTVAMLVAFLRLCVGLAIAPGLATGLAVFLAISPTIAQYEHLLFYTHLEIALLVVAARGLQRWAIGRSTAGLATMAACLSALALGRSLYHPVWIVGLGALLVVAARADRRRALALALAVPLVCSLAVGTKNLLVFGWWTTGSLEGINLHRITEPYLTEAERARLVEDGTITDVSVEEFSCRDAADQFPGAGPDRSIPVLDRAGREADPQLNNMNERANVACFRTLRSESLAVLVAEPAAYLRGVGHAVPIALYSAVPDVRVRPGNQDALDGPGRVEALLLGSLAAPPSPLDAEFGTVVPRQMQWLLGLVAVGMPIFLAWATVARWRSDDGRDEAVVLALLLGLTLTGVVLTQLTEVGENSRLVLVAWPMLLAGLGLAVTTVVQRGLPLPARVAEADGGPGADVAAAPPSAAATPAT